MRSIDYEVKEHDFEFAHSKDEKLIDKNYKATSYAKVYGQISRRIRVP